MLKQGIKGYDSRRLRGPAKPAMHEVIVESSVSGLDEMTRQKDRQETYTIQMRV